MSRNCQLELGSSDGYEYLCVFNKIKLITHLKLKVCAALLGGSAAILSNAVTHPQSSQRSARTEAAIAKITT